jgi:magnesium and cobalt transporter
MAIVIDEFGSAIGMITLEDVLEQIVGEVVNLGYNFEAHLPRIKGKIDALGGDRYRVDERALLSDVAEALGVPLANTTVHTIGGLLMRQLRHLPRPGESLVLAGYRFALETVSAKGVTSVVVESA